jgi:membrane protease YdiL (CAAX protease family)
LGSVTASASSTSPLARAASLVWSPEERRLRALLRIALYVMLMAVAIGGAGWLTPWQWVDPLAALAIFFGLQMLFVLALTWFAARAIDRRRFVDLGLAPRSGYVSDVVFGVAAGGGCMGAIAVVEQMTGWAVYDARVADAGAIVDALSAIGTSFSIFVAVAVIEELTFRGYAITNLGEGLARRGAGGPHPVAAGGALVLSSIAFGVAHAENPSASWVSIAYIAFGGVFLGTSYLLRGDLAMPIGLHLGWNFFQNLLGMPVSGRGEFAGAALLSRLETGPDVATGGAFGPEAGLTGLCAMALGIAMTLGWVRVRAGRLAIDPRLGRPPSVNAVHAAPGSV